MTDSIVPQSPSPVGGDLSYRAIGALAYPRYRLALERAACLLREFLHGRVKINTGHGWLPVLAEDTPTALRDFTSGEVKRPRSGVRVQRSAPYPPISLFRYTAAHHRLGVETEDAVTRTARFGVIDFDGGTGHSNPLTDPLGCAQETAAVLASLGWPHYLVRSNSGQGYHLYTFFQRPVPSADVRRVLDHVLRVPEAERARVEINPMRREGEHGSLIHLPWWALSRTGCNAFIDPVTLEEIAFPDEGFFRRVSPAQVADLLAQLPAPPVVVPCAPSSAGHPKTRSRTRSGDRPVAPNPEMDRWRDQVGGDPRLIETVYGPYLTGERRGAWLVCRDPASPTGDQNPSAGVAFQTGTFHTFLGGGRSASIFTMMQELGLASSIGEAYRKAEAITGVLRPPLPARRTPRTVDRYVMPTNEPPPALPVGFPKEEARAMVQDIVEHEVIPRVLRGEPATILLRAGTGTGKSHTLAQFAQAVARGEVRVGERVPRVLWLANSIANRDDLVKEFLTDRGTVLPTVAVAYARSPEDDNPGYCWRFARAHHLAARRQPVSETLCKICMAEEKKIAKAAWKALSPDERAATTVEDLMRVCPYATQRERCTTADVVVGTRQAFQFGGDLIEGFNLVVVDEQVVEMALTSCTITLADVGQWEARRDHDPALWELLKPVIAALKQALTAGAADEVTVPPHGMPLVPLLRRFAPGIDDHLERLWFALPDERWVPGTKIDRIDPKTVREAGDAPLLVLPTLVTMLADECRRGTPRDVRCWLLPGRGDEEPQRIHLAMVREELLASLGRACTTVLLDATAHVPTLSQLWGTRLRVYEVPVQTYLHTTVFADLLYGAEQITKYPERAEAILAFIEGRCALAERPMLVLPKALLQEWRDRLPPHAETTYWGAGDTAGSNRFIGCDMFVGIGHPRAPAEGLIRETMAVRATLGNTEPWPEGYDPFAAAAVPTPYPGYRDAEGQAWVRWAKYPVDADARDRALNAYAAQFTQTVGRMRPADPRSVPIPAYLLCGEAPRDLRVDAMASLPSIADGPAAVALPDASAFAEARDRANQARSEAAFARYLEAARRLLAEGKRISPTSLQRECGGKLSTAQKHYPAVCQALGLTPPAAALQQDICAGDDPLSGVYAYAYRCCPQAMDHWERLTPREARRHWATTRFGDAHAGRRVLQADEVMDYAAVMALLDEIDAEARIDLSDLDHLWEQAEPAERSEEAYWAMVDAEADPAWADECAFYDWWATLTRDEQRALVAEKCAGSV